MLDGGWSYGRMDICRPIPEIDLDELVKYGKQKNVRLFLWASWLAVEKMPSFLDYAKKVCAAGVKIDFMDRSYQWMINFHERTAKKLLKMGFWLIFMVPYLPRD